MGKDCDTLGEWFKFSCKLEKLKFQMGFACRYQSLNSQVTYLRTSRILQNFLINYSNRG